jgi:titin
MVIDKKAMWVGRAKALALYVLVLLVVASIGVLLAAKPAHAVTFSVNRTADTRDANLTNAACDVDASQRGNQCTLRAAIQEPNDTPGQDLIRFNIVSAASVKTISPTRALPIIREALTINGYTQTGASPNTLALGNNTVLKIQLNGTNAGASTTNGLEIEAANTTIRGLVINRFAESGIQIDGSGATGNVVAGNFIGTNAAGSTDLGNGGDGVRMFSDASNNTIGGTTNAARNIISGNDGVGFQVFNDSATGNEVMGNYIGTDASGTQELGNRLGGVFIGSAPNNTVGGTAAGAGNLISGNENEGVAIQGPSAEGNEVLGNRIGLNADGSEALPNSTDGVLISNAPNNTVGGTDSGARNIISGNGDQGVKIFNIFSTGNQVLGNFVGTDASGTADLGNGDDGVEISPDAENNTVGGTASGARNVISGNDENGIRIQGPGNKVEGNFIGTNASGTAALGNTLGGVRIDRAPNNTVGGTQSGARNIISGNGGKGVLIFGSEAIDNTLQGNFIGTNAAGTADLGNDSDGVFIFGDASNNTVGGTTSGARNIISGNGFRNSTGFSFGNGVRLEGSGNKVEGNFIGTDATGTAALGNTADGVDITSGATNNTVGGTQAGARNIISGNGISGVLIFGAGTTDNEVQGNLIGTKADGSGDLGNIGTGVVISLGASNNTVGGTQAGARNIISGNDRNGVGIGSSANKVESNIIRSNVEDGVFISDDATANSVLSNSIFSNGGLGIDLAPTGVTPNDNDDPDTGANNLQNFPVIDGAARSNSLERTAISGTINSNPNQQFTVQCFVADGDSSNHGEGVTLAGQDTTVQTNAGGNGSFECISGVPRAGDEVSVTATNEATGDTSEFSVNRTVILVP